MATHFQVACALEPGPYQKGSAEAGGDKGTFYTQANVDENQKAAVQKAADDHKFYTEATEKARALLEDGIELSDVHTDARNALKLAAETSENAKADKEAAEKELKIELLGLGVFEWGDFFDNRFNAADAASRALVMAKRADTAMADADTAKAVYDDWKEIDTRFLAAKEGSDELGIDALVDFYQKMANKSDDVKKAEIVKKVELEELASDHQAAADKSQEKAKRDKADAEADPGNAQLQDAAEKSKADYDEAQARLTLTMTELANQKKVYKKAVSKGEEVSDLAARIYANEDQATANRARAGELHKKNYVDTQDAQKKYKDKETVSESYAADYVKAANNARDAFATVNQYINVDGYYQALERSHDANKKELQAEEEYHAAKLEVFQAGTDLVDANVAYFSAYGTRNAANELKGISSDVADAGEETLVLWENLKKLESALNVFSSDNSTVVPKEKDSMK